MSRQAILFVTLAFLAVASGAFAQSKTRWQLQAWNKEKQQWIVVKEFDTEDDARKAEQFAKEKGYTVAVTKSFTTASGRRKSTLPPIVQEGPEAPSAIPTAPPTRESPPIVSTPMAIGAGAFMGRQATSLEQAAAEFFASGTLVRVPSSVAPSLDPDFFQKIGATPATRSSENRSAERAPASASDDKEIARRQPRRAGARESRFQFDAQGQPRPRFNPTTEWLTRHKMINNQNRNPLPPITSEQAQNVRRLFEKAADFADERKRTVDQRKAFERDNAPSTGRSHPVFSQGRAAEDQFRLSNRYYSATEELWIEEYRASDGSTLEVPFTQRPKDWP